MAGRTDVASRVIEAGAHAIYAAFVDPDAYVSWLPPKDMSGEIHAFEPHEGGVIELTLTYREDASRTRGKTTANADTVLGRFVALEPGQRIVQAFVFRSHDPAFAGEMTMTWTFSPVGSATQVAVVCENVPVGIRPEDHDAGLRSSLENLAAFVE